MRNPTSVLIAAAAGLAVCSASTIALAQTQYIPSLVYRSGPYAPNGIPFANGVADYYALVNARDGGINGVKIELDECETGYATDRGVECYERTKGNGEAGAPYYFPLSTGITFALTEKTEADKIPLITMGYGRSESADGRVFKWNFPLLGTYWSAADIIMQYVADEEGGYENLSGKKITLVYHDSPYGKEPIPLLERLSSDHGFEFTALPVTHPGVEQKSTWLQIRQSRPDYVLLWGWGVMNSTAIREAVAVNYPREQMIGVWWSGAEPDVTPAGEDATGYKSAALQHSDGQDKVHEAVLEHVYANGQGAGREADVGHVLYNRGLVNAMLGVEAIRTAQEEFGNRPLSGEEVQRGIENLELTKERIEELGFGTMLLPLKVTCEDHEAIRMGRIHQWDGKSWNFISDWIEANNELIRPMVEEAAASYATEHNITPRECN